MSTAPSESQKGILFLQTGSVFETVGGIEYYQDDFLELAAEVYSKDSVCALFPKRRSESVVEPRPYRTAWEDYSGSKWIQKIRNRIPIKLFHKAKDLIQGNRPNLLIAGHVHLAPLAYALHRVTGIPFAVNVHGIECWGKMWPQDEWCLKKAQLIMPTSHWTKRILVGKGFEEHRVQVVHPRLATSYEKLLPPSYETKKDKVFTLLTIARLDAAEKYKGQDHVLEALSRWRARDPKAQFRYVIQGQGSDEPRLRKLAAELGLEKNVEFRPRVKDRADFERVFRDADVYVMPSRFGYWNRKWHGEGFGIVFLEASAYGLPLVAYDCGGVTDIIRHNGNGFLVQPDDIEELSRTLERLAGDEELRRRLGAQAYTDVMERFTKPAIKNELTQLMEKIQI